MTEGAILNVDSRKQTVIEVFEWEMQQSANAPLLIFFDKENRV